MKEKRNKIDRRDFLKRVGAAGLAPAFAGVASVSAKADSNEPNVPAKTQDTEFKKVPKRALGKTGVEVPCLALGTIFDVVENQVILRKALQSGVSYWDTAHGYAGGNSELGIGKFLSKNPDVRKDLFIVSKASGAMTVADVEKRLQDSLKRMNTEYVDLYYGVHGLDDPGLLTDELKQWAKSAKQRKLIRFFGFSTHKNMAECLAGAAKLDWIDAIMPSYNFRLMQDEKMQAGVEACYKAGIGLIAMKTQAKEIETENDKKLAEHFLKRGFTEGQAKVKIVLEDERISSACVGRDSISHLNLNIDAVLDKTRLSRTDIEVFREYAAASCNGYCAGCANICGSALPDTSCVSEIMRYLMYYNSYGQRQEARELFAQIPAGVRIRLLNIDYGPAEARCPQHIPIRKLMAEAVSKLA